MTLDGATPFETALRASSGLGAASDPFDVIPAKAGIHLPRLDSGFRRNDGLPAK